MGKIIAGFPGTGKSHFTALAQPGTVLDSDSSQGPKDETWPHGYIEHIRKASMDYDTVFVSTHKEVRAGLVAAGLPFYLVYPDPSLKAEYMQRYVNRGSPQAFINLMEARWGEFVHDCAKQRDCQTIMLTSEQTIGTIMPSWNAIAASSNELRGNA